MIAVRYIVDQVDAASAFYVEHLGFTVKEKWGPVTVLTRDGVDLWISGPGSSAIKTAVDGALPRPGGSARLVVTLKDLEALLASLAAAGVKPRSELVKGPAGSWTVITDPAGNHVELFQPK